ncbi:unnamed protein product [Symbiodinium sp. CCMP2456]|nr:unnamed protein product [Symbiodinium sp. CCMP2456]
MMVTGGLGGLGLIASFHCAAEFDNPIITTSRSGRLGSGGASAMNMFEALKEMVPVYNVRLNVANAQDTADVFAWVSRPGMPPEDSKILIDDVVYQVRYKIHSLPDEALRRIQEFLLEVKEKLLQIMKDMRQQETKIDQSTMADLSEKEAAVSHAIGMIRAKVGAVPRSGQCRLLGGVPSQGYGVPDADALATVVSEGSPLPSQAPGRASVPDLMEVERLSSLPKPIGPTTSDRYRLHAMSGDSWTETPWSWFGSELRFGTSEGSIRVREESRGPRGSRARCSVSGSEYDLRRLVARPTTVSGHVSLEALESVQREAELSERAGKHPNIVRCHGILVQNVGAAHCQLLLCEPCASDLSQHVASKGGTLLAGELADLGQQLAMGLSHLHSLGMLYGSLAASGALRGSLDGLWKLGDFSRAAALPVAASEWRSRSGAKPCEAPPEARGSTDDALKPEADVWLLASLVLATLCAAKPGDAFFALAPERLLDSAVARLWLLLQWLLAEAPEGRPSASEAAALLGTATLTPPQELLFEMPSRERRRCCGAALAAARQRAAEAAAAEERQSSESIEGDTKH